MLPTSASGVWRASSTLLVSAIGWPIDEPSTLKRAIVLGEPAEPAAHDCATFRQHRYGQARSRRPVRAFNNAITIDAHAELERQSRVHSPAVLREHRKLGPLDKLRGRRAELSALRKGTIKTTNFDRAARAQTGVLRTLQVGAELEDVLAAQQVSRKAQRLNPLVAAHVAFLIVEEAAALRLGRVGHRGMVVAVYLDLEMP
jgi:hypothetical protein